MPRRCSYPAQLDVDGGSPCSTISSENRCFSFILAALRMVRIDRAVRPCFPITFPTSLWATRSRMTVESPSAIAWTETPLGSSTRACAISVTSSVIFFTAFSPEGNCVASVITHTFGFGSPEETLKPFPWSRLQRDLPGNLKTSETPVRRQSGVQAGPAALQNQTHNSAILRSLREIEPRHTKRTLVCQLSLGTRPRSQS
jgi:hypothetical protein